MSVYVVLSATGNTVHVRFGLGDDRSLLTELVTYNIYNQTSAIPYASRQLVRGGCLRAVWTMKGKCYVRQGKIEGGADLEGLKYVGQLGIIFPGPLEHVPTQ